MNTSNVRVQKLRKSKGFTTQKAERFFYPFSIDQLSVGRKNPPWHAYEIMLLWTLPTKYSFLMATFMSSCFALFSLLSRYESIQTQKTWNLKRFRQRKVDCMALRFSGKGFCSLILMEFHRRDSLMHFWYSNFTRRMGKKTFAIK